MHEISLYGQVPKEEHQRLLHRLAGFTRMQPQEAREIHLIFKASRPSGLDQVQSIGASHLVNQQQHDVQRVKNMLNGGLYYLQLVGEVHSSQESAPNRSVTSTDGGTKSTTDPKIRWTLEFKDTPDPARSSVSTRLISRTPLEEGNLMDFVKSFGYEYASRYMLTGSKFYDNDTTLFVHKALRLPQVTAGQAMSDQSFLSRVAELPEVDTACGYVVQASIEAIDGNNTELRERATRQLMALKEALKDGLELTAGDRLALDTRLPLASRR